MINKVEIIEQEGILFFIDVNTAVNYERMLELAIKSIKYYNNDIKIALVLVNDQGDKVKNYCNNFVDYIIDIPAFVDTFGRKKKISNINQIYWASPFKKNIYIDCDFIILNKIDHWFELLDKRPFLFTSSCKDFRGQIFESNNYKQFFYKLGLDFVYSNIFMFNKDNDETLEFFNILTQIQANYQFFYDKFIELPFEEEDLNIDISLALKLTDNIDKITNNLINWIDLNPKKVNYTDKKNYDFYKYVNLWFTPNKKIKYENYILLDPVHYANKKFINSEFIEDVYKNLV